MKGVRGSAWSLMKQSMLWRRFVTSERQQEWCQRGQSSERSEISEGKVEVVWFLEGGFSSADMR